MPGEHSLTLTEGLHAPSHARAWVSSRAGHVPTEVLDDALLLVSELVTNAVRHGEPDIVLTLDMAAGRLRLEVFDGGSTLPVVPVGQPSIDRPTGRGLLIVAATAADWGVLRPAEGAGKTVWVELVYSAVDPLGAVEPATTADGAGA